MKTIGLIGGMSWESTLPYYRVINETVRNRLGGLHSAKILLHSHDFHAIEVLQRSGDWEAAGRVLVDSALTLKQAGADCIVVCTNTMHKVANRLQTESGLPFLHIADPTAEAIRKQGMDCVALLGTRFTMEEAFYKDRLQGQFGLRVLTPDAGARAMVHRVIYEELCQGKLLDNSREQYQAVIADLVAQGAEGVILGCTEIALLIGAGDSTVPLFDTARIHAESVADWALGAD